jgi:hypothetical protein
MKKNFYPCLLLFLMLLICQVHAFQITNITIKHQSNIIFINNSMSCNILTIGDSISFYNISSEGFISNTGNLASNLTLFNLNQDIKFSNDTILEGILNISLFIPVSSYIEIGDFGLQSGSGSRSIGLTSMQLVHNDWVKGKENEIVIYTYDKNGNFIDPDTVILKIPNLDPEDYEYTINRVSGGTYIAKVTLLLYNSDNIGLYQSVIPRYEENPIIRVETAERGKTIFLEESLSLIDASMFNDILNKLDIKMKKFGLFFSDAPVVVTFCSCVVSILVLAIFLYLFRRRKT